MNSVLLAIAKLYKEIGRDESVLFDIENDYLTENTTKSGRLVLSYLSNDIESAIYIDTLEFLTSEEIEKELY